MRRKKHWTFRSVVLATASSCCLIMTAHFVTFAHANYVCAKTLPNGSVDEVIVNSRKEKLKCE